MLTLRSFALSSTTATVLLVTLAGCGSTGNTSVVVPENLQVAASERQSLELGATGVQIYVCTTLKNDASKFEWSFKAPEADLFNAAGAKVGKHYAGPTWESKDGSKVVGAVKARNDGPVSSAIPLLLLGAKSNSGSGDFAKITSIQRLATEAGVAPAEPCAKSEAGQELRVPYKALYRFFVAQ